jgi:predicted Zn-dependent protease
MAFQVTNSPHDFSQRTGFKGDPVWKEDLCEALESGSVAEGTIIFLEDRQDVSISFGTRVDGPQIESSRSCGVAAQGRDGHSRYRADPQTGDLGRLLVPGAGTAPEVPGGAERNRPAPWAGPPTEQAAQMLAGLIGATSELQPRAEVQARWIGFDQRVHLGQSGREVTAEQRSGRRVRVRAEMARSGRTSQAVGEAVLRSDDPAAVEPTLQRLAAAVAARVEARLGAETLPDGARPIVFAPGVGGVLVHELIGHALEADSVLGRTSWLAHPFSGSLDLRVLDDPRRGRAAWHLDDEGQPARATPLVKEGRAVGWLHDRTTARLSKCEPTGHGRRASFREPVRPRMGCTFLAPGRSTPEEAIHGLETGVYIRRMEAAGTDTRTGRAVLRVTDADRIQNGRRVAPLAPHVIRVDGRAALESVECVADDLAFDVCIGSCLHHGQSLAVSVGSPTFRIGLTSVHF